MSATPNIDNLRARRNGVWSEPLTWTYEGLLQEIDAIQAQAATTPPVRARREHKGVVFANGCWVADNRLYPQAADIIAEHRGAFTDDDHAPLLALRADPFEPLPDVHAAVRRRLLQTLYQWDESNLDNTYVNAAIHDIIALVRGEGA
jgi:hypothetical protein